MIPKNTLEKVKGWVKQGSELYNEYPKIGDFLIGLISGAATSLGGVAIGSQISETKTDEPKHELNINVEPQEINFNENGAT